VVGGGDAVDFGEPLVDADVAQAGVEDAQADRAVS
jgi:hypothetical protein